MLRLLKLFFYAWSSPTSLLGLFFLHPTLLTGGRARVHSGVLEIHGGLTSFFLTHCTLLPGGASAMTLGHVVLGRDQSSLDRTRPHERIHVSQCETWGPFFLPAYAIASLIALLRRQDPYLDNQFERDARNRATNIPPLS
ncbi:MAG TPA: hypothetical protein VGQ99_07735 [Tepidisphaeraceae bacterium]|jgi:hypothetical protein|nr:hypothetical protein [Tepidisphaeraceae bacterium]